MKHGHRIQFFHALDKDLEEVVVFLPSGPPSLKTEVQITFQEFFVLLVSQDRKWELRSFLHQGRQEVSYWGEFRHRESSGHYHQQESGVRIHSLAVEIPTP